MLMTALKISVLSGFSCLTGRSAPGKERANLIAVHFQLRDSFMDGSHAGGCSFIGLALTTLMVRMFWMSSPPFNKFSDSARAKWKASLVAATILMTLVGGYMLSRPADETARQTAEEGFRFH